MQLSGNHFTYAAAHTFINGSRGAEVSEMLAWHNNLTAHNGISAIKRCSPIFTLAVETGLSANEVF